MKRLILVILLLLTSNAYASIFDNDNNPLTTPSQSSNYVNSYQSNQSGSGQDQGSNFINSYR